MAAAAASSSSSWEEWVVEAETLWATVSVIGNKVERRRPLAESSNEIANEKLGKDPATTAKVADYYDSDSFSFASPGGASFARTPQHQYHTQRAGTAPPEGDDAYGEGAAAAAAGGGIDAGEAGVGEQFEQWPAARLFASGSHFISAIPTTAAAAARAGIGAEREAPLEWYPFFPYSPFQPTPTATTAEPTTMWTPSQRKPPPTSDNPSSYSPAHSAYMDVMAHSAAKRDSALRQRELERERRRWQRLQSPEEGAAGAGAGAGSPSMILFSPEAGAAGSGAGAGAGMMLATKTSPFEDTRAGKVAEWWADGHRRTRALARSIRGWSYVATAEVGPCVVYSPS
jgi:hypothetical protein